MDKKDTLATEAKKIRQVLTVMLGVLLTHLGMSMGGGGIATIIYLSGLIILAIAALQLISAGLSWVYQVIKDEPVNTEVSDEDWELTPSSEKNLRS